MINKLLPRVLNSSSDNRIRKKNEMKDAVNITVSDDFDRASPEGNANVNDSEGDVGVIKPAQGTAVSPLTGAFDIDNIFLPDPENPAQDYERRVLGTVTDQRSDVVYMFVYSNVPAEQGVYAYDDSGYFGAQGQWRPIYTTPEFNFDQYGVVVGTVIHVSGGAEVDFRPILYFTDDQNEPRRLDVLRCIEVGNRPGNFNYLPNSLEDKDIITACPKAPVYPPTFQFIQEPGIQASDFRRVPGVQFAYQCVYASGEVSAISTYSDIAVPEEYMRQGTITGTLDLPQLCRITVQQNVNGGRNFSDEVVALRFLVRRGNTGGFFEIDEVPRTANVTNYNFFNDRVLKALTESEENKQYDNLPKIAQAVASGENRMFYGNYVEGFDEVPLEGIITPRYIVGATTGDTIELNAVAAMINLNDAATAIGDTFGANSGIEQRAPGVVIDTSEVPQVLNVNTTINVTVEFDPAEGFALYNVEGGYHNSRLLGTVGSYVQAPVSQLFDLDEPSQYWNDLNVSDQTWILPNNRELLGRGFGDGVGGDLEWVTTETIIPGGTTVRNARIGTSAGTPLRIQAQPVTFQVELITTDFIINAPYLVGQAIGAALSNETSSIPPGFSIVASNSTSQYSYNLNFADPTANDGDATNLIRTNDPRFGMVIGRESDRTRLPMITPVYEDFATASSPTPCGYIVVNSATVQMKLVHQPLMTNDPLGPCVLTLEVQNLNNVDVRTCIPIVTVPQLTIHSWRVFSGDYLTTYQVTDVDATSADLAAVGYAITDTQLPKLFSAVFWNLGPGDFGSEYTELTGSLQERAALIGYLRPAGTELTSVPGSDLYISNDVRRSEVIIFPNTPSEVERAILAATGTSMFDGEGAYKWERAEMLTVVQEYDQTLFGGIPFPDGNYIRRYNNGFNYEGSVSSELVLTGALTVHNLLVDGSTQGAISVSLAEWLGQTGGVAGLPIGLGDDVSNVYYSNVWVDDSHKANLSNMNYRLLDDDSVSFSSEYGIYFYDGNTVGPPEGLFLGYHIRALGNLFKSPALTQTAGFTGVGTWQQFDTEESSQAELLFSVYLQEEGLISEYRSFKTSAFHDLGVVYYDDRGRPGNVNLLPRVYVGGYSDEQRGGAKGRVELEISLLSTPPEWAHQYQIVYAGNSTYSDFIQYSIGGAFADERGATGAVQGRKIYLSLNYLQENDQVSYAKAFGAYHPDGSKELYTFVPGDQLRVISYQTDDTSVVYPNNLVFDIIDQVLLTNNDAGTLNAANEQIVNDEVLNPLDNSVDETPEYLQGSFIVVRDIPNAQGFSWQDVNNQSNDIHALTSQSNWGKNCVVELLRPRANSEPDERAYQETGLVFGIGRGQIGGQVGPGPGVYHQAPVIVMSNGDVWWRRVPVNLQEYNADTQIFQTLIPQDQTEGATEANYQPRFRNTFLECRSFTDTFPLANVNGFGKKKFYFPDAAEVRRDSSITYSDRNDYSRRRLRYSSFNPYQMPFVDLPNQYGPINSLVPFNEFILVIQEDKTSMIPINRNILSDASGGDQLIRSNAIIGTQKFIPGEHGADNNRESVIRVDESVYFAHKSKGEVYRYRGGKIEIVSRKGVSSALYDAFQDSIEDAAPMRVVSGYDGLKDEYIISIMNLDGIAQYFTINPYTQPVLDVFVFDPTSDVTVDGTTFEDVGGAGGGVIPGLGDTGGGTPLGDDTQWDTDYQDPMADLTEEIIQTGGESPDTVVPGGGPTISDVKALEDDLFDLANGIAIGGLTALDTTAEQLILGQVAGSGGASQSVSMAAYIPANVAAELGNIELRLSPASPIGQYPTYNSVTNTIDRGFNQSDIQWLSSFSTPGASAILGSDYSSIQANVPAYYTFLPDSGDDVVRSIRGIALARAYEKRDEINSIIVFLKNGAEENIVKLSDTIATLLTDIEADLSAADLLTNSVLSQLLTDATNDYQLLDLYLQETLLAKDRTTINFVSGALAPVEVDGFAIFQQDNYPLGDLEAFVLSQINTQMQQIGQSVEPLLSLDAVDVSSIIGNLGRTTADLRNQIDVLTSQIQNLSAAPVQTTGETFIPEVTTGQLTQQALANFAGADGVLTRDDVRTELSIGEQFNTILELFGSNGVEITADLVKNLANSVVGPVLDQYAETEYAKVFYNAYRTDGQQNTLDQDNIAKIDRAIDFANFDGTGAYGSSAITSALADDQNFFSKTIFESVSAEPTRWYRPLFNTLQELGAITAPTPEIINQRFAELLNSDLYIPLEEALAIVQASSLANFYGFKGLIDPGTWSNIMRGAYDQMLDPYGIADVSLPVQKAAFTQDVITNPNKISVGTGPDRFDNLYQQVADQYNAQ